MATFHPIRQALKDDAHSRRVAKAVGSWRTRFCWTCQKDKTRFGGKESGQVGVAHARHRFTCADCIAKKASLQQQPTP